MIDKEILDSYARKVSSVLYAVVNPRPPIAGSVNEIDGLDGITIGIGGTSENAVALWALLSDMKVGGQPVHSLLLPWYPGNLVTDGTQLGVHTFFTYREGTIYTHQAKRPVTLDSAHLLQDSVNGYEGPEEPMLNGSSIIELTSNRLVANGVLTSEGIPVPAYQAVPFDSLDNFLTDSEIVNAPDGFVAKGIHGGSSNFIYGFNTKDSDGFREYLRSMSRRIRPFYVEQRVHATPIVFEPATLAHLQNRWRGQERSEDPNDYGYTIRVAVALGEKPTYLTSSATFGWDKIGKPNREPIHRINPKHLYEQGIIGEDDLVELATQVGTAIGKETNGSPGYVVFEVVPTQQGPYVVDVNSGQTEFLLSLAEIAGFPPPGNLEKLEHHFSEYLLARHASRRPMSDETPIPLTKRARYDYGSALQNVGRTNEALEYFREALRVDPEHMQSRKRIGQILIDQGHTDDAWRYLLHAKRFNPHHNVIPDINRMLAKLI